MIFIPGCGLKNLNNLKKTTYMQPFRKYLSKGGADMAIRRCLSTMICQDDDFMSQTIEAQYLYFMLNLNADDAGFINGWKKIMRMIDVDFEYLEELVNNDWIYKFEKSLIIRHWWQHNNIRSIQNPKPTLSIHVNDVVLKEDHIYYLKSAELVDFPTQSNDSLESDCSQSNGSQGIVYGQSYNLTKHNSNNEQRTMNSNQTMNNNNEQKINEPLTEADLTMLEDVFREVCSSYPSQKINYHSDLELFVNEVALHHEDVSLNDYANRVKSAIDLYLKDLKSNNTEVRFYSRLCNLFLEDSHRGKLEAYLLKIGNDSVELVDDTCCMDFEDIQNYISDEDYQRYVIPQIIDICQVMVGKYKDASGTVNYIPEVYKKIIVGLTHCESKKINDLAYAIDLFASFKRYDHNYKSCELAYFLVNEAKNYLEMSRNFFSEDWVRNVDRKELLDESRE